MVDFAALIVLQRKLPPDCPLRVIPFLNDPLAFIGEKELEKKAAKLKECLAAAGAGEEILKGVDSSLSLIRQAEKQLAKANDLLGKAFPGYECACRGSLFQTSPSEMKNTLWLEAFRQLGEFELTFQAHVSLDLKPEWAQVMVLSKARKPEMAEALKFFDGKGWSFKEVPVVTNHVYVLENASPALSLPDLLQSAREVTKALEKKFSAAS